jgi:hypothetical protein
MRKLKPKRSDGADAFIPESAQGSGTTDDLAEYLAEQYLRSAGGEESEEDTRDAVLAEEMGGPFVETLAEDEFSLSEESVKLDGRAGGIEPSAAATLRSALPQAVGSLAIAAPDEELEDQPEELEEPSDGEEDGVSQVRGIARLANPEAEPASRVEANIKIDDGDPDASLG